MVGEGVFPKSPSDILYASEANAFNTHGTGDGSDHADVATNTTHSTSDGSTHADVAANTTLLATKTSYLSIAGIGFGARNPDVDDVSRSETVGQIQSVASKAVSASVNLPHGAVVTACIVYGVAGIDDETWYLRREEVASGVGNDTMATAAGNTEDTSISNATIDNSAYRYWISTSVLSIGDIVYGARITYTTNYN